MNRDLELEAMRAARDCTSALAETAWHGCRLRCEQLVAAHGLIARMAEELPGHALVDEAARLRSEVDVESLVAYPVSRAHADAIRQIEADADERCVGVVADARRDPWHPLHKFVVWVERSVDASAGEKS